MFFPLTPVISKQLVFLCFGLFFSSGSHAVLASELLVRQSCGIKRPLPFPGLPLHSRSARNLRESGYHSGLRSKQKCTSFYTRFCSSSRMWKQASLTWEKGTAFICSIKFLHYRRSVLTESQRSPILPTACLVRRSPPRGRRVSWKRHACVVTHKRMQSVAWGWNWTLHLFKVKAGKNYGL